MSNQLLTVVGLALFPAIGNFGGGLLAEWLRPLQRFLNWALHAASGILVAVISIEVMPEALRTTPAWVLALVFVAGGGFHLLLEAGIERWQAAKQAGAGAEAWMVYLAVASDLIGDGLLIGTGSTVSTSLALVLAVGQVFADVPEGFAVLANFRDKGVGRSRRLLLSASFVIPVLGSALLAYLALRGQSEAAQMAGLCRRTIHAGCCGGHAA